MRRSHTHTRREIPCHPATQQRADGIHMHSRVSDRSLYIGGTRDLEHRLTQHNEGEGALYTRTRLPGGC
ncbi:GIY-YIG nuclease family protein [Microbacterium pumilum]|uniref:GIY-YIG nuclease family protein n=1 Tax=Microbacterium pumilum TaxID=344165 RepID=UPI003CD075A6